MTRSLVRRALGALLLLLVPLGGAAAQVLVSPPLLFMNDSERFGTFLVENRSTSSQEVTIDFRFGYPASDTTGSLFMQYEDSASARKYGMTEWIRAFPRQFVLQPGRQQIVRLTVRPPGELAEGVYWTRLVTASVPESPPADTAASGVTTQIVFRLEQVTTAFYRHGAVETGVQVGTPTVRRDEKGVHFLVPMKRVGSAPFLGTATLRLRDEKGALVEEARETIAVYFDLTKSFDLPPGKLASGSYSVEVAVSSDRNDIPAGVLPPVAPVTTRATVQLR